MPSGWIWGEDPQRLDDDGRGFEAGARDVQRGEYNELVGLVAPIGYVEGYERAWDTAVRPDDEEPDR